MNKFITTIKPIKSWQFINLKELYQYRDLFFVLVMREIKVRYKQTVLGGLWAIIQPFFSMVVFSLFFGTLAKMPSDNIPYPIFNYSAMIAWTYFANVIITSGNSVVADGPMISKVYFPRLILPLAPALSALLDFCIAFSVLIAMMFYFRIFPTYNIIILPLLILLMMFTATGTALFLSALNAKYRDFRYIIPFGVQFWMFCSPIVYPTSLVPEEYQLIYSINPMVGIIEGFRSVLLNTTEFPTQMVMISFIVSLTLFIMGSLYYKQMERHFADVI